MQNEEKILIYLQDIAEGIGKLDRKIDAVEESLNARMDAVEESLNKRIDAVEESLNVQMNEIEKSLNEKIDYSHDALLGLITH
ncbi:MAG: hypothetical protein K2P13_08055, partial [Lachnospiraceae bacterium]|nr:hypothetical protein [Lachnospiraceae bacterium]